MTFERQVYLMGTRASLAVTAHSRARATRALNRLVVTVEATDRDLSTWRPGSLISVLNRQPVGDPWAAPSWLCELVTELATWSHHTGRAFDPTVGSPVTFAGLRHLVVEASPCTITRLADVSLDVGAFGKGFALDRVAALDEPGLINLGGQVAAFGPPPDGGWLETDRVCATGGHSCDHCCCILRGHGN